VRGIPGRANEPASNDFRADRVVVDNKMRLLAALGTQFHATALCLVSKLKNGTP
jgi:hypothetical protein